MAARIVGIIQARMGSTRLPGKVLRPILGRPMLVWEVERLKRSRLLGTLVVATSTNSEDDAVVSVMQQTGVPVFRGDEDNVLDRFYKAAKEAGADVAVRLTGDCPLHDSAVVDEVVGRYTITGVDYTKQPENYPEGLDTEAFSFTVLEEAWKEAQLPSEREHVTLYIRNHPERFALDTAWTNGNLKYSHHHWSVDTEEDYHFVSRVYEELYDANTEFGWHDVVALLDRRPELCDINKGGTGFEGLEKSLREDEQWKKKQA